MSTTSFPPFFKWGDCKSKDHKNPDKLKFEILDQEPFETLYDWNVSAIKDGTKVNVPLRAKSSNKKLYKLYMSLLREGKITVGTKITINTWLRKSTKDSTRELRDFEINL